MISRNTKILLSFILLFLAVNVLTLKDGHNWGDDFSQYILHAKNIVEHEPYQRAFDLDEDIISPPGYPILLTPLVKYFGLNFIILKFPNLIFWVLFVLSIYFLMRKRLDENFALLGTIAILTSPVFFVFKQNILTDIPFLAFSMGAICLFEAYAQNGAEGGSHKANLCLIGASFLMFYSLLLRFSGIVLFISAGIYFSVFKKDKRALIAIAGFGFAALLLEYLFKVSFSLHLQEKTPSLLTEAVRSYEYLSQIFIYIFTFFFPQWTTVGELGEKALQNILPYISLLLLAGIIAVFCHRISRKKITFLELFTMAYLVGLVFWGMSGGGRYVFPLAGPVLILFIQLFHGGWGYLQQKIPPKAYLQKDQIIGLLLFCLIVHNVWAIAINFRFDDNDINKPEVRELVQWVDLNVGDEERVMFPWNRALRLLTGKKVITYFIASTKEKNLAERIQKHNVKYLIVPRKDQSQLARVAGLYNVNIRVVWMNKAFLVFMLLP